jgi:hypothetical protein
VNIDYQALLLDPIYATIGVAAVLTVAGEDIEEAAATATLTFGANPTDGQTVTIGARTYTYRATLSSPGAVGDLKIAATADLSLFNLYACLRPPENGGGPGLDYALANVLQAVPHHPDVDGTFPTGPSLLITAKVAGAAGNAIATTTNVTGASWTAATMTGGADEGPGTTDVEVTVIDKTGGVSLGDHDSKVETLEPAACIRYSELTSNGLTPLDLDGGSLEFNGSSWKIKSWPKRPVPSGARKGELLLILGNETVTESDSSS